MGLFLYVMDNAQVQLSVVDIAVTFHIYWATPYVRIGCSRLFLYSHSHESFSEFGGRATGILSIRVLYLKNARSLGDYNCVQEGAAQSVRSSHTAFDVRVARLRNITCRMMCYWRPRATSF